MSNAHPCNHIAASAQPNFMEIAPPVRALQAEGRLAWKIVLTGQHYDRNVSEVFFDEFGVLAPDMLFDCGAGSDAARPVRVMGAFERHCEADGPAAVASVRDVNSALACTVVARKARISLDHVERGSRSGDGAMPEAIHRIDGDSIADWPFGTKPSELAHPRREQSPDELVIHVDHVMVDNAVHQPPGLTTADTATLTTRTIRRQLPRYGVVTLHHPSNKDDHEALARNVSAPKRAAVEFPLVFPVLPRIRVNIEPLGIELGRDIRLVAPQGCISPRNLWEDAMVVLTDSAGLQEEDTALGAPCSTNRGSTGRPVTVAADTNTPSETDPHRIVNAVQAVIRGAGREGRRPAPCDGQTASRFVNAMADLLDSR